MKMTKYSSIKQFRNTIKDVKDKTYYNGKENDKVLFDYSRKLPTLTFTGYVKIHGTNSGIGYDGENYWIQSREHILSKDYENEGFYSYAINNEKYIKDLMQKIKSETDYDSIIVFGEWCGQGIQKRVGVSELEKRFIVFDVCGIQYYGDNDHNKFYLDQYISDFQNHDINLYNKNMFKTFTIDIDFEKPEYSINTLVEMTNEVERECPVAKYFDIVGGGEGIVFETIFNGEKMRFKSKGEKHSVSKVKTIVQVDPEVIKNIDEFVEYSATENRLQQGLEYMNRNDIDIKAENLSKFIKWISHDIIKEEMDVLLANNLEYKQVGGKIAVKAREYFFSNIK